MKPLRLSMVNQYLITTVFAKNIICSFSAIQTNPGYLKQLLSQSASPNGIGQTIPLPPAGVGRSTGIRFG